MGAAQRNLAVTCAEPSMFDPSSPSPSSDAPVGVGSSRVDPKPGSVGGDASFGSQYLGNSATGSTKLTLPSLADADDDVIPDTPHGAAYFTVTVAFLPGSRLPRDSLNMSSESGLLCEA